MLAHMTNTWSHTSKKLFFLNTARVMSVISRKKFISSYGVALLNNLPSTSLFHLHSINLHVIFICLFVFWISKNVPIGPSSDPFQDAVSYSPPFSPWGRTKYLKSSPHLWEVTQQTSSGVLLCFRGFVVAGFGGLFLSFALGILPLLFVKPVSLPCSSAPHSTSLPSDINHARKDSLLEIWDSTFQWVSQSSLAFREQRFSSFCNLAAGSSQPAD